MSAVERSAQHGADNRSGGGGGGMVLRVVAVVVVGAFGEGGGRWMSRDNMLGRMERSRSSAGGTRFDATGKRRRRRRRRRSRHGFRATEEKKTPYTISDFIYTG